MSTLRVSMTPKSRHRRPFRLSAPALCLLLAVFLTNGGALSLDSTTPKFSVSVLDAVSKRIGEFSLTNTSLTTPNPSLNLLTTSHFHQLDTGTGSDRTFQSEEGLWRWEDHPGETKRQLSQGRESRVELEQNPQVFPYMPALFAFGDSDFDVGNSLYLNLTAYKATAYPPYGESYNRGRSPKDKVWGRFCDGLLIPDFLAEGLGLPIMQPNFVPDTSFFRGTSFAIAGSGLLNSTRNVYNPDIDTHLFAQVEHFLAFQKTALEYWSGQPTGSPPEAPLYPKPSSFSEALYVLLIGGNDILKFRMVERGVIGPQSDAFVDKMVSTYEQFVQAIYAAGGRKFVLFTLGNVGCAPLARLLNNGSCSPAVTSICTSLANAVAALPARLKSTAPDATVLLGDMLGFNQAVEKDPSRYGIQNTCDACCGGGVPGLGNTHTMCSAQKPAVVKGVTYEKTVCTDPSSYQYWDQFHLTQTMNRQLSYGVLRGGSWVSPQTILDAFVVPRIHSGYEMNP